MASDKSIVQYIEECINKGSIELPVFDVIALKLQKTLASDNYNSEELSQIVLKDQSLSSKILKMANSAFYSGLNPITTIQGATIRLGSKSLISMVMIVTQQKSYNSVSKEFRRWMEPLWVHSLGVAMASKWLAQRLGLSKYIEESFLAGLLHDIGKLLLLKIIEELRKTGEIGEDISESVIRDVFETLHCTQGYGLMKHLNMPDIYCNAVLKHDDDDSSEGNILINLVKLANLTCHKLGIGLKHDPGLMLSATNEAINLMATDLLLAELQVELEGQIAEIQNLLTC